MALFTGIPVVYKNILLQLVRWFFFVISVGTRGELPEDSGRKCPVRCRAQTWETEDRDVTAGSCWLTEGLLIIVDDLIGRLKV